ncbi:hypothetical protein HFN80_17590 [Rhizobium laguerreae]|nr:hypothetical protein [Rhizobium laguerreae]
MTDNGTDPYGSTETNTQYEVEHHPASKGRVARSAWALAVAAVFLVVLGAWIALQPHSATDPAPGGSPGNAGATEAAPSTSAH